ncbi:hypothetical protein PV327_011644 [Microctonus hyperodae]|uniref:Uncharacterized protein n=1 Tax=Microctonus hyperodae TaxID=165561 RepID=A0AA39KPP4_MICHY|nr:hypothetical protein PV327_011644 [Microctonus hyperodae]
MDFFKLHEVSRLDNFRTTKPLKELKEDSQYQVTAMDIVKTKFGECVIATLNDEFIIFLPKRITTFLLKDENIYKKTLEAATKQKLTLHYIGGKYHTCEFLYKE